MNDLISDACEIMDAEFGQEQVYQNLLAEERVRSAAAKAIYEARVAAGLTQKQLADIIGTSQSVICRLEDSDYERHSLAMLQRIAAALNQRIELRFVPSETGKAA